MSSSVDSLCNSSKEALRQRKFNSFSPMEVESDSPSPRLVEFSPFSSFVNGVLGKRKTMIDLFTVPDTPDSMEEEENPNYNILLPSEKGLYGVNYITPFTLLKANQNGMRFLLIDCRFPYEYGHGRIKGAVNVWNPEQLLNYFPTQVGQAKCGFIIVFYCEFSGERGPNLARLLHSADKKSTNPYLIYNEIYVIENGFQGVMATLPQFCEGIHISMNDVNFGCELAECLKVLKTLSHKNKPHSSTSPSPSPSPSLSLSNDHSISFQEN